MTGPDAPPPLSLAGTALFLDFDGTLVELAEAPDLIEIPETLPPLLERLQARLEGRLAIVSGRAIADLERHLGRVACAVSGSHGFELRLADGRSLAGTAPERLAAVRHEVARFAAGAPGLLVEEKPAGIAIHYRRAPQEEGRVAAFLAGLAERAGLVLQRGKMVVELRPPGADKGEALKRMMTEPPFAGARPLFVGDDLTDEHAFAAAAALGGAGVLVGASRETAARWRLADVASVARWLEAAAGGE
ncbi:MAG TPA: trehalose-phosphatase [Allosphingosinicella sp.]|jgi:trehalose 6-phosphate phosphatase|nr:trehalose-phosphatase [Allosphingosinicella sp.]